MPKTPRASRSSTSGSGSARSSSHSPSSPCDVALIPCTKSVPVLSASTCTRLGTINGWSSPSALAAFCAWEMVVNGLGTSGPPTPSCRGTGGPGKAAFPQHDATTIGVPLASARTLGRRFR